MGRKPYEALEAKCPFFCDDTARTIYCESPVGEHSHLIVTFEDNGKKVRWERTYCSTDAQCREETRTCRIARMLDEMYNEKDSG